jgi:hypothetical protein
MKRYLDLAVEDPLAAGGSAESPDGRTAVATVRAASSTQAQVLGRRVERNRGATFLLCGGSGRRVQAAVLAFLRRHAR